MFGYPYVHSSSKPATTAPRGLGRPQIGHLELEGKANHGELWDACLSSQAPAVVAKGRAGGAGMPWVLGSRAAGNTGTSEVSSGRAIPGLLVGSLPRLLFQPLCVQPTHPTCRHTFAPGPPPDRVCGPAPTPFPTGSLGRCCSFNLGFPFFSGPPSEAVLESPHPYLGRSSDTSPNPVNPIQCPHRPHGIFCV